ncbi:hypothetical protein EJ110_NYTH30604 [Nymphaea thermarum]|nr:hypothetical protein EJ110_NYTH30604 [Nymphaea thermarum]
MGYRVLGGLAGESGKQSQALGVLPRGSDESPGVRLDLVWAGQGEFWFVAVKLLVDETVTKLNLFIPPPVKQVYSEAYGAA